MQKVLITGATGNVGISVIDQLYQRKTSLQIVAAARNLEKAKKTLAGYEGLEYFQLDFEQPETYQSKLGQFDQIFLMRPPHIAKVKKYFEPFVAQMKAGALKKVIFLSVQGVEKSKAIPHHQIENLLRTSGFDYVFLRPSYFMQNLTTTFKDEIRNERKIVIPAGNAKFNWIDTENIGEVAAIMLNDFDQFANLSYELTGDENLTFQEVTNMISELVGEKIEYRSPNPLNFFQIKKSEGFNHAKILVLIALHYLARYHKAPRITKIYEKLTGKKPTAIFDFLQKHKAVFLQNTMVT